MTWRRIVTADTVFVIGEMLKMRKRAHDNEVLLVNEFEQSMFTFF